MYSGQLRGLRMVMVSAETSTASYGLSDGVLASKCTCIFMALESKLDFGSTFFEHAALRSHPQASTCGVQNPPESDQVGRTFWSSRLRRSANCEVRDLGLWRWHFALACGHSLEQYRNSKWLHGRGPICPMDSPVPRNALVPYASRPYVDTGPREPSVSSL